MKRINVVILLLLMCYVSCDTHTKTENSNIKNTQSTNINEKESHFDPTYVHVVYFWFKEGTTKEDHLLFEKSLRTFLNTSQYAKTNFIGIPPQATRAVVDDSFTYNLVLSFDSAQAQKAYQNEAAHKVFIKECEHLWEKVIVYDAQKI